MNRRAILPVLLVAALSGIASATTASAQTRTDIVVGLVLEPPMLDPTAAAAAAIDEVTYANIFEGLTRFAPDGAIAPALARDWTVSEDGLTYIFHLAENVTFHDGAAFSAEDVKFSLERATAEGSLNTQQFLFEDIVSVTVVDPLTVEIALARPNGNFLFNLAWGDAVIVSPATAETNATNPVGTGPFRFDGWTQGDSIRLVRSQTYWGEPVALERAVFRFIDDPTAAYAAMMAGDVDTFPNFPAPETVALIDADPRFRAVIGTTEGEVILGMNNRREPFEDIRVREAIARAINRQDLIDGAMFGYGTPIGSHFAPHHPAYIDLTELSPFDPDSARALLAEAGGVDRVLDLALPPTPYARRGGEIIAAQLRAVGIETRIVNVEWSQWLETVFGQHDYDLSIVAHVEPLDIEIYGRPDYYFGYESLAFDAVMEALRNSVDEEARTGLWQDAQRILAEDFAAGFLFQLAKVGVENVDLDGLWANAPTPAVDLTGVSWVR